MALTLSTFRARVDERILAQLTDSESGMVVNEARVVLALADTEGVIEGYLYQLPSDARPPVATMDAHQAALAMAVIAGNRPGEEFESIRSRAKDALKYLEGLAAKVSQRVELGQSIEVLSDAPEPLFDAESLGEFGSVSGAGSAES